MNLIIINSHQFGYQTDYYYYCKYLKHEYSINYICWNHNLPKVSMEGIKIIYVDRGGNFFIRGIRFLRTAYYQICSKSSIVLIKYFKCMTLLLRFLKPSCLFILDIRSASVDNYYLTRLLTNNLLKFEALFFNNITVISNSLANKLQISHKAHILPLGANIISFKNKSFDAINLLYVGTLYNRNLINTVIGFNMFYKEYKNRINIKYLIIGDGPGNELEQLNNVVLRYCLHQIISITGYVQHKLLQSYFDESNIGVGYIPLTEYYDCQPPTKIFEYLLSGLPVIATCTKENRKIINRHNGVIIGDSAIDFYHGLKTIYNNLYFFDSSQIRNSCIQHTWENIVTSNLKIYLSTVSKHFYSKTYQ